MFRTKKDVERHVADIISKIDNENEKNLRGYTFARLFFQVKDFDAAKKHLTGFLSVRDHHAPAHKLMAQIYETTNSPESALQSFKRSLEIDSHQNDIILKICELYCRLSVDHETARYWADRAEQLFPHNETVFKLRECLVSAEGEPDNQELEHLIASELAAQPRNVGLRIKLLRLYLDTERIKEAYDHASLIENKRLFPHSVDWYYLLGDICEAYQEEYNQDLNSQFYINYLTCLDCLIKLTLAEAHTSFVDNMKNHNLNDAASVLLTFDQLLNTASEKDIKGGSWFYFIHHMKGQLFFHMVTVLLKQIKLNQGNRKEALRFTSGLALVCYSFKPANLLQEIWFSQLEENQKAFTNFFQQGSLRNSFIGHLIMDICKENKAKWLSTVKLDVCISQVKERIYNRVFNSVVQKDKIPTSFFILDSTFEKSSLEFPSEDALLECDKVATKLCSDSLHHLVWLELHKDTPENKATTLVEVFKGLQFSNKNLSRGSCETLCVLDMEAFLCASVYTAQSILSKKKSLQTGRHPDFSQISYLPDIDDPLCSKQQISWWRTAHGLHNCSAKEKLGDLRRELQHGLEIIRGIGYHGMEVQLVVHLARMFANKADSVAQVLRSNENKRKVIPENVAALQFRAIYYWKIVIGMLEKLSSGQTPRIPKEAIFVCNSNPPSADEISSFREEGQLYLAVQHMDANELNEAANILSKLSSPYGSYYLALTLQKFAHQEESDSKSRKAFLTSAKNSIHDTMDRIKENKTHPLNKEIYITLEDIENELGLDMSNGNVHDSEELDETDSYDPSPVLNRSVYSTPNSAPTHSTPRPTSTFTTTNSKFKMNHDTPRKHFEPSPERLDAQIRALALNQDTLVKSLMEQQHALLETNKSMVEALKQHTEVLQQLQAKHANDTNSRVESHQDTAVETNKAIVQALNQNTEVLGQLKKRMEELKISEPRPQHRVHKQSWKGQGDEDYTEYDPNSLLEYYTDEGNETYGASGYAAYNPSSRIVHEATAAPLNYVMSPTIPQGPPPALPHYSYQYPHLSGLPPPAVVERPQFYHAPPGQGLPFSEGQALPQFHFHVASAAIKASQPGIANISHVPPSPLGIQPPQNVIPRAVIQPLPPSMPMPAPWGKAAPVQPHDFQIPLPPSEVAASVVPPPQTTQTQLKSLLSTTVAATTFASATNTTSVLWSTTTSVASVTAQSLTASSPGTIFAGLPKTGTSVQSPQASTSAHVSIFAGLPRTPEMAKLDRSRCDSENADSPDIDSHDLEREVMGDFKPLIPLPAEVVVETGEENEEILFEERAKLFRYVNQEWKERGLGQVKILHNKINDKVRLLMRRDQVLKVCANHYITSDMSINPLKTSDRAWTWMAQDFADEELKPEHFCIRFKTSDIAAEYKSVFEKALKIAKNAVVKKTSPEKSAAVSTPVSSKGFGSEFLPKAGTWECSSCYVNNNAEKLLCLACDTPKPGSSVASTNTSTSSPFVSKLATSNENTSFSLGTPLSSQSSSISSKPVSGNAVFGGFTFSSTPTVQDTVNEDPTDREVLVVSTKTSTPQVTKITSNSTTPFAGFSFSKPTSELLSSASSEKGGVFPKFTFNSNSSSVSSTPTQASKNETVSSATSTPFSLKPSTLTPSLATKSDISLGTPSLSSLQSLVNNIQPAFEFGQKKVTDSDSKTSTTSSLGSPSLAAADSSKLAGDVVEPEEFVPTVDFKPVVPLPALVDVTTGEEEEEIIFEARAKLFRYDATNKEWKERGTGDIKILHKTSSTKYRILMRRDHVLKTCANHYILPEMKLTPMGGNNNKSWIWYAQDYSDGDLVQMQFAIRFKTAEIAQDFFEAFNKCRDTLKVVAVSKDSTSKETDANPCSGNSTSFDQLFKASTTSWNCLNCDKPNMNESSCVYCKAPKSSQQDLPIDNTQKPLSELFKQSDDTWECNSCYVRNKSSDEKCVSCETAKPGTEGKKTQSSTLTPKSTSSLFSLTSGKPFKGDSEKSDSKSETNAGGVFGKLQFGSSANPQSTFTFGTPKSGNSEFVFGMKPKSQPTTFTFGQTTVTDQENQPLDPKSKERAPTSSFLFGDSKLQFDIPQKKMEDSYSSGFKFGSPQKFEFNFSGVKPRSPTKAPKSPHSPGTPSGVDAEENADDSYDGDSIYFQPVIPLPPKVDVKTGEENEKVLFSKRAKLYRFASGEWKERGLGDIKVLLDQQTNKIRLLMRREQVLKVCLNHILTTDIKFEWRGDKSLSWAATDFSDNEPSADLLAVRFKTPELAQEFKQAIDDALNLNEAKPCVTPPKESAKTTFSFKSEPTTASNFAPGSLSSQFGVVTQEKPLFGSATNFSFSESPKNSSGSSFFSKDVSAVENSFFRQPATFGSSVKGSLQKELNVDDDVEVVYESLPASDKVAFAQSLKLPPAFFLYENAKPCPGCIGCTDTIPEYESEKEDAPESVPVAQQTNNSVTSNNSVLFANSSVSNFSFSDIAAQATNTKTFTKSPKSSNIFAGAGTQLFANLNTSGNDGADDTSLENPDIHFEPIVPLPDLVEVKTGEEDETPLFTYRAKLFRFDPNTKQWKERGIGDIKILQHNEKSRFRILMRRDQVHNIACNHFIAEDMNLAPLATSESALCWTALDYSDNKPTVSQFAVRFKNRDQLIQFKNIFIDCQGKLKNTKLNDSGAKPQQVAEVSSNVSETVVTSSIPCNAAVNNQQANYVVSDSSSSEVSDEEEDEIVLEKQVTFEIYDEAMKCFKLVGTGHLLIKYDDNVYGYNIEVFDEDNVVLCSHVIAVQNCLRVEGLKAVWSALDITHDPPKRQQFRATFASIEDVKEFDHNFEEGKEIAVHSGIVENDDSYYPGH